MNLLGPNSKRMGWGTEEARSGLGEGDKLHFGHSKLEGPGACPGADVRRQMGVFMGLRLGEEACYKLRGELRVNPGTCSR